MKQIFVKDLTPDSPVRTTFLVQSKERKITSNGAAYLDLSLQDTTGVISAKLWDYSERTTPAFEADDIVQVEGHVESYRGTPQLRIRKIAALPAGRSEPAGLSSPHPARPGGDVCRVCSSACAA